MTREETDGLLARARARHPDLAAIAEAERRRAHESARFRTVVRQLLVDPDATTAAEDEHRERVALEAAAKRHAHGVPLIAPGPSRPQ